MSRTFRYDNGLDKGRDHRPFGAKCGPMSSHPKGFDTFDDDHGHYGAGGSRAMKHFATRARRIYNKNVTRHEINNDWND
jgi:hypothetical protein